MIPGRDFKISKQELSLPDEEWLVIIFFFYQHLLRTTKIAPREERLSNSYIKNTILILLCLSLFALMKKMFADSNSP
jgi:hypothetical protein